jgi:tRNA nucleotidyltransferase/poly(A) polymerase
MNVSKSRISKEWMLILNEDKRREIIETLLKSNVFRCIFGEDIKADVNLLKNRNALIETLNIFYENETETLIKILDTLLNGLKKREESAVRRMKSESKSFDRNNKNIAFLQLK